MFHEYNENGDKIIYPLVAISGCSNFSLDNLSNLINFKKHKLSNNSNSSNKIKNININDYYSNITNIFNTYKKNNKSLDFIYDEYNILYDNIIIPKYSNNDEYNKFSDDNKSIVHNKYKLNYAYKEDLEKIYNYNNIDYIYNKIMCNIPEFIIKSDLSFILKIIKNFNIARYLLETKDYSNYIILTNTSNKDKRHEFINKIYIESINSKNYDIFDFLNITISEDIPENYKIIISKYNNINYNNDKYICYTIACYNLNNFNYTFDKFNPILYFKKLYLDIV